MAKNLRYISLGLLKQTLRGIIAVGNVTAKHKPLTRSEYIQDLRKQSENTLIKKQFCAICGTTKKIHIHHIMPNRISHNQDKENLIPLCASCHPKIERVTRDFLKAFDGEYEKAEPLLRMILRQRQYETSLVIKEILNGNRKDKD